MPSSFNSPCACPGCRQYALPGKKYCARHEELRRKEEAARPHQGGNANQRGYSRAWRHASKLFLLEHPLCVECLRHGKATPATDVDHIVPHKGNKRLFWDRSNWQPLCHECHSRKTVLEDGGFGRAATPREGLKS